MYYFGLNIFIQYYIQYKIYSRIQKKAKSIILKGRIRRVNLETVHLTSVFSTWKCEYIALIDNTSVFAQPFEAGKLPIKTKL